MNEWMNEWFKVPNNMDEWMVSMTYNNGGNVWVGNSNFEL
jgi:hypothetical protein